MDSCVMDVYLCRGEEAQRAASNAYSCWWTSHILQEKAFHWTVKSDDKSFHLGQIFMQKKEKSVMR